MSLNALLTGKTDGAKEEENSVPDHIVNASAEVRQRLCALKKLHLSAVDVQIDFYKRVHELETEFRPRFEELNKKRAAIVTGDHEPKADECDAPLLCWMKPEDNESFLKAGRESTGDAPDKGVPDFWLTVLRSHPAFNEVITEADESILHFLSDITIQQSNEPPSFTLEFHFQENPFFKNKLLTKYYKLSIGPNELEDKALYDGPNIIETKGCEIDWHEGKNITQKVKKQKKSGRQVTKVVPNESFFTFFSPSVTKIAAELPEEEADQLHADFELGQLLRDSIIDSAVLFYTGEIVDEDDDIDFGQYEGDEDEDEEEEEEEEE
ncbi:Nucleosome assembly protein 1-like 1 [Aphelenchoides besseyi]|nr:Nucleosome assembly protein 1-like 1 [Aphelenchoides besseyi]